MSFVYAESEYFWKSIPVLLILCLCDCSLLIFFIKSIPARFPDLWKKILLISTFYLGYFMLFHQYLNVLPHSLILLALISVFLFLYRDISWTNSIFMSSAFVLILELSRTFVKDGLLPNVLLSLFPSLRPVWINIMLLICCMLIATLLIVSLQPIYRKYETIPLTIPRLFLLLLPFFLYIFVRYIKFYIMTGNGTNQYILLQFMQIAEITVCACAIAVTAVLANMVYAQQEVNRHLRMEMLMQNQQEQYRIKAESIAAVNRKYHDLKHMVSGIRAMDQKEAQQFAAALEKEIQPFEFIQETGHPVINILLSEKIRECQEKKIRLIPYIDASSLNFISDFDLCSLFGNAADNAIEAVSLVPEEHREIYIKIRRSENMMILCFQNAFTGILKVRDGHLITSKTDTSEHGFGSENIRQIVEKYNGSSAFEADDHVFTLNILIPIPENK